MESPKAREMWGPGLMRAYLLGERIRIARERLGITQEELASRAGISAHQIVSQIERGGRELKAAELFRLAQALHLNLASLSEDVLQKQPVVLWRKKPEKDAAFAEARFLERCRRFRSVMEAVGRDAAKPLPQIAVNPRSMSFPVAEEAASHLATTLNLGPRPAASLREVLESEYEVQVWFDDLGRNGSAASTRGEEGAAVMINSSEPPWRRNYDLAHELFHLVTWDAIDPLSLAEHGDRFELAEKLAETFASNLLLPADAVAAAIDNRSGDRGVSWADLIDVARDFDVSTEALLWRLRSLRRINQEQVLELKADERFRQLDKSVRRGSWWEPSPLPERFVRHAFLAYLKGHLSRTRLAEFLETNLAGLPDRLADYGLVETDEYQNALRTA